MSENVTVFIDESSNPHYINLLGLEISLSHKKKGQRPFGDIDHQPPTDYGLLFLLPHCLALSIEGVNNA
jgi:hypothetical protein